MADRRVTKTRKDSDGDILSLCNDSQVWSPRDKADAIKDIDDGVHTYYVQWKKAGRTDIHVVDDKEKGKYLRTDRDDTDKNNLDELEDC